jgi:hypothetical protein
MERNKKVHDKFCKKLTGVPRCTANGFVAKELARYSRRGELVELVVKYRYRFMCVVMENLVNSGKMAEYQHEYEKRG